MEHQNELGRFSAVISAAGQASEDLARRIGTVEKCAARLAGRPIVAAAVEAVLAAGASQVAVVCGEETRAALGDQYGCLFAAPGTSPVRSAVNGVRELPEKGTLVFIPGDLPFIKPKHIAEFVEGCPKSQEPWVAAGVCSEPDIAARFPGIPGMKYSKLSGKRIAGGGIFAASPAGFEIAAELANDFSRDRKSALRMAWQFGVVSMLRFLIERISVKDAERAGSRLFGCAAHIIESCAPELIADIDEPADWDYALSIDCSKQS